jgi:hypothetical protein
MRGYDRGYDYGLRGFRQTAQWRDPVRARYAGGGYGEDYRGARGGYGAEYRRGGGYDFGYGATPYPNRVTAAYNLDYVREPHPGERPVNYAPYGGDRIGRIGDGREYHAPYQTTGGTRTWRGEWPMGWERQQLRYGVDFPRRGDIGRWL